MVKVKVLQGSDKTSGKIYKRHSSTNNDSKPVTSEPDRRSAEKFCSNKVKDKVIQKSDKTSEKICKGPSSIKNNSKPVTFEIDRKSPEKFHSNKNLSFPVYNQEYDGNCIRYKENVLENTQKAVSCSELSIGVISKKITRIESLVISGVYPVNSASNRMYNKIQEQTDMMEDSMMNLKNGQTSFSDILNITNTCSYSDEIDKLLAKVTIRPSMQLKGMQMYVIYPNIFEKALLDVGIVPIRFQADKEDLLQYELYFPSGCRMFVAIPMNSSSKQTKKHD